MQLEDVRYSTFHPCWRGERELLSAACLHLRRRRPVGGGVRQSEATLGGSSRQG